MRLRNIPGADDWIAKSPYVIQDPVSLKGKWSERFGNDAPIRVEIGCGKGRFITQKAEISPGVNFIGIEQYSSVLYRGIRKLDDREQPNILFIRVNAAQLPEIFEEGEVDRIYVNFPDPWPKDRHAKRRLMYRSFLELYDRVLAPGGRVEFKTDNEKLFDFALEELEPAGWQAVSVTRNLHSNPDMMAGNVETEYEEKFSLLGYPIYKCIITRLAEKHS
ncbi:MAG: tRNA (guanosine(46)-N7)-methyltransferase TrmB [Lachnospiraceae bacterium]|nr:tRNA (guanosine(46)-N7)-methyltransferase TrmB [Lachnospiraceae bacterium]